MDLYNLLLLTGQLLAYLIFGFVCLGYTATIVHELGHAGAARWFGLRVSNLVVHPWAGCCSYVREGPASHRSRVRIEFENLVIAASGPGANVLVGLMLLGAMGLSVGGLALVFLPAFGSMNLISGLVSFWGLSSDPTQDAHRIRQHYRQWRTLKKDGWAPRGC